MELQEKFYEKYNINPEEFDDINVEDALFSVRVYNRLQRAKICTIGALLNCTHEDLERIDGFGAGCFKELDAYFESISKHNNVEKQQSETRRVIPELFRANRELIVHGDYSFINSQEYQELEEEYKEARDVLGEDLANLCLYETEKVVEISHVFSCFAKSVCKLYDKLNLLPRYRRSRNVKHYIYAYTCNEVIRSALFERIKVEGESLEQYIRNNINELDKDSSAVSQFVMSCSYNLFELGECFFSEIAKNERAYEVVRRRSEGMTLEQVGNEFDVTRERVRQIEKKVSGRFVNWVRSKSIVYKILAEMDGKNIILPSAFSVFFGTYGEMFCYLLKINEEEFDYFTYDKQVDVFVIGDESLISHIQEYVDEMPDTFNESQLGYYLDKGYKEYCYPKEITKKIIEDNYGKTGDVYHRSRLTLVRIYEDILKKYYPNGIWVYNDEEIDEFRKHVKDDYGDIKLPENNRAIMARITYVSILCDRGTYCPKKDKYISDSLAEKIHDYIVENESPIFLTNTLFNIFEEELVKEGVSNKYYLQGILRELYEGEFIFRRDYISKDENLTSVYSEIVSYIEKAAYPVTKRQLNEAFPGVTEIVINISTSDPDVINLFGVYIHASKLKLDELDKKYLKAVVISMLDKSGFLHCKDIYDFISRDNPNILTSNGVYQAFGLYSVLEYLFRDELEFSRPYIGQKGQEITRTFDQLHEMVEESDVIQLAEIASVARDNHFQVNSILEFANSCNNTHLLLNDKELAAIDYIGLSKELAREVEQCIFDSISGTVYVSDLRCIKSFPRLSVPWTEWLVYSLLYKWCEILEVAVTSTTFKQAKAVVARRGELDVNQINEMENVDGIYIPDNMDDIDELISNILFDEIEG